MQKPNVILIDFFFLTHRFSIENDNVFMKRKLHLNYASIHFTCETQCVRIL